MNKERPSWYRLGTLIIPIVSVPWLFKAAATLPSASSPVAAWVILSVCAYGVWQICEVIFGVIAAMSATRPRAGRLA
jgi:hypothetical protein